MSAPETLTDNADNETGFPWGMLAAMRPRSLQDAAETSADIVALFSLLLIGYIACVVLDALVNGGTR